MDPPADYDDVLVPTDGSNAAMAAAEQAVRFAARNDATLHALYVMDMGDAAFVATPSDIAETRDRLEGKGEEYTAAVEKLADEAGVLCVREVRSGTPIEEIVAYVDEHDVDLVVVGKRGRSDPDKPLLGSTTRRVTARLDVPVFTV
ncbi:MAG: universal stress protein [Halobacteriales archaeon]